MPPLRKLLSAIGTGLVVLVVLAGGALVAWNLWGQGPYDDTCRFSIGCRSFYCIHHELAGSAQMSSGGRCTKSCERDEECGSGARCVELSDASRDDLPPFGKPDKACLRVRELPADIRR
jgi:hypothetical protein